ncbi:nitrilase-related carbon-nitrogen hydrolase [Motilimonas eburnea]|uniref:nitrilase-related carbon-nitrogen hydrolase n=1 Tax=Motilimonas eburnea TaxID=1737488 RepID=UPI001E5A7C3D|nr:nitrilase-related carbon-nitrogen hydrolase [Motilimonas eburnea]MCE2570351.1 hypothetical protein [Motilimonas eburnea]
MGLATPGYELGFITPGWLAWFALVPALYVVHHWSHIKAFRLLLPATISWSCFAHAWFMDLFGTAIGLPLMIAAGFFFARVMHWGIWLSFKVPDKWRIFALPLFWCSIEYLRFVLPYLEDVWFVLIAKTQWQQLNVLQLLSITGFVGVSFLVLLSNTALTQLVINKQTRTPVNRSAIASLLLVILVFAWGQIELENQVLSPNKVKVAATVDLSNQDPQIQSLAINPMDGEGYWADTPAMSQAIFDVNAQLTKRLNQTINPAVDVIVWPENEMANLDDALMVNQVKNLAKTMSSYLVVDMIWEHQGQRFDTAVMYDPHGNEILRTPKIAITFREKQFGFTAGTLTQSKVVETSFGRVGLGICYDRHRLWITRHLKQQGAQIILMPVDDDFRANRQFPLLHATDSIFRAIEHRVAFSVGTTSGVSMVISPYGELVSRSGINQRALIQGEVQLSTVTPFYSRYGDVFAWLICAITLGLIIRARRKKA